MQVRATAFSAYEASQQCDGRLLIEAVVLVSGGITALEAITSSAAELGISICHQQC